MENNNRAEIQISADVTGAEAVSFGLFEAGGRSVAEAFSDPEGRVAFPAIHLDTPGLYFYTIQNMSDETAFPVHITVFEEEDGILAYSAEYPEGRTRIAPSAKPLQEICVVIRACIEIINAPSYHDGDFNFGLYADDRLIATGTNNVGIVEFGMRYTEPGCYFYTIKQFGSRSGCFHTDDKRFCVVVNVYADACGCLHADVKYPDGFPVFVNTYVPIL